MTTLSVIPEESQPATLTPAPEPLLRRAGWWLCLLIALCFAGWGLRTAGTHNVVDTDGARHAMNGAFMRDLIARGSLTGMREYGRYYYAHLPALSLPYHPPLFPAIEGVAFLFFGVSVLSARLLIAASVALSAVLLFRLVFETHRSRLIAALSTITFLSLPFSFRLASDVMLEFPALAFVLAALWCLAGAREQFPVRRALVFAVIAAAAVWTKQQTVFLGAVPFLHFAILGRWKLFRQSGIWTGAAVFALLIVALSSLSVPFHGAGISQASPPDRLHVLVRNFLFYVSQYPKTTGPAGLIRLSALAIALAFGLLPRKTSALYASWAVSLLAVLLLIGPYAARYLFFAFPAMIVLGYVSLFRVVERLRGQRWATAAVVTVFAIALPFGFPPPKIFLRGPDEAAQMLAALHPRRILYCGGTDGNFIFNYRSFHSDLDTVILAGDKLPPELYTYANLEAFARRYGVQYIVLERIPVFNRYYQHAWDPLFDSPTPSMVPERDIPLTSSDVRWNGTLRVYRFTNPSPNPADDLTMRMNMIGGTMDFHLDK